MGPIALFKTSGSSILHSTLSWITLTHSLLLSPQEPPIFSVLDLEDAFFPSPCDTQSQNVFAFISTDPGAQISMQLTWTVPPKMFWDNSHLLGQALASDIFSLSVPRSKLTQ